MFSNKMVVAVKNDGRVLRESNGEVQIPFNSEYSLLIKNLESRKAVVKISIDGSDVLDGSKIVLNPNTEMNLEGFLKNSVAKNKFKFIEKTKQISDFRGDRIDDSLVRIEFQFEKEKPIVQDISYHYRPYWYDWDWYYWHPIHIEPYKPYNPYNPYSIVTWTYTINGTGGTISNGSTADVNNSVSCFYNDTSKPNINLTNTNQNDIGITVKGNEIHQEFSHDYTDELEDQSHVIVLKLKGYSGNSIKIEKPLFVREKLECEICGTKNDSSSKFCKECGNFLDSQY